MRTLSRIHFQFVFTVGVFLLAGFASAQTPTPTASPAPIKKKKVLARKHERPPLHDQFSGQGYGAAGCGLGSIVFGPKPGPIQIAAATLNMIALNQTFGITTGTSNCDIPESAYPAAAFIEANKETLAKELSRGEGESVLGLASLLKCHDTALFTNDIRSKFPSVFDTTKSSLELTRGLLKHIETHPDLAATCDVKGS